MRLTERGKGDGGGFVAIGVPYYGWGVQVGRTDKPDRSMEMSHPVSYPYSEEEQTGGLPETHYRQEAPEQRMSDSQRQVKHAASITPQKKEKKQLIL